MLRRWLETVGLAIALGSALVASNAPVAEARPPLLEEQSGCELWLGEARGNDPGVRINLRLCPGEDGALTGELQWSGRQSGWNLRAVAGTRRGERMVLGDVRIVEERPEPGWRFCTIERYELRAVGADRLTGRYVSTSCDDQATVELHRVSSPAAGGDGQRAGGGESPANGANGPTPTGGPDGPAPTGARTEPTTTGSGADQPPGDAREQRSGCACATAFGAPADPGPGALAALAGVALGLTRRRRP